MESNLKEAHSPTASPSLVKNHRDWFGYLFTTIIGIVATIFVAWYQLYATQKEVAAAELERARSVKQSAVAIVEEQVLNAKKLEPTRLARLIDQRRRDENISLKISVSEVVEQAEFNVASSHHLSVDKKEEIKPLFDDFYSELSSRTFSTFQSGADADLLNDLAKKIQDGKSSEALAALKRLDESHQKELSEVTKRTNPNIIEALRAISSSPAKISLLILCYVVLIYFVIRLKRIRRRRKFPFADF